MPDKELVLEILSQIHGATKTVIKRFEPINSAKDFTDSEAGMEKLDAICMQLISIGEGLKNLDKVTENRLLTRYPQIEWKKVMGMRDIISHHYFDVDAEAIFLVCRSHVGPLAETLWQMIRDIS
ncbi:MAG: HepT-like ribonuclease domain-containing protein [Thermodesulfobacteriota bacterium]|nr:HepT-like ribonuclease domain-containing protein [Thermodesulfobacteriota bacterium]